MLGSKGPTISDIARIAGVSTATVSRVINSSSLVNPDTRKKVHDAMRDSNYEPAHNANRSSKHGSIGVFVPDIANPWFPLLVKGIENAARIQGYNTVLCDSENKPQIELRNIKTLVQSGIAGMIVVPTEDGAGIAGELPMPEFPLVFLDRVPETAAHSVTADNRNGAYQATKYLLSLGHRDIVYVAGPPGINTEPERYKGYREAIEEAALEVNTSRVIRGDYIWQTAQDEIEKLMQNKVSFTAIFASNDVMAFGIKQALQTHGLRIPQDVSIIGFDDTPFADLVGLTSVHQPTAEMGRSAFFLLMNLIEGKLEEPQQITLRTSLIIRDSCKKL